MTRRLLNVLAGGSLAFFVVVAALLARTFIYQDAVIHRRVDPTTNRRYDLTVSSDRGEITLTSETAAYEQSVNHLGVPLGWVHPPPTIPSGQSKHSALWWRSHQTRVLTSVVTIDAWQYGVKLWLLLLLASVTPLLWLGSRTVKHRQDVCPKCGYDLRATPERCPECGHVPIASGRQSPVEPPSRVG